MPAQLPPDVLAVFSDATVTAFGELTSTVVEPQAPLGPEAARGEVFARIELRREEPGTLVAAFPESVLRELLRRYVSAEALSAPGILEDAAGEFANVIAGQAKTALQGTAYHYLLSAPQSGRTLPVVDGVVLPFVCEVGSFQLWVRLSPCAGS